MADTVTTETVTPGSLSNDGSTTAPLSGNAVDPAEVERIRREAEQAKMRAQQLQNQLEERRKADEAARQQQLEKNEEFRTLYEQTQSKLDALQANQEAQEKRSRLASTTDEVLREYPEGVVSLARTTGLTLSDDSEEAKAELKSKLEGIKSQLGPSVRVAPNNPANTAPTTLDRRALTTKGPDGYSPMAMASARGDDSLTLKYIHELPAIQRMREISKGL